MKKILVTGGTGYIGSHTAVELLNKGYEVVIIDNLSNSRIEVLDGIKVITGILPAFFEFDLADRQLVFDFFSKNKPDAIIHFAALKAVGESVEKPLEYYRNNLVSILNLLEAAKKYGTQHFVFSSSCTVYGQPDYLPIDERAIRKNAESPYGNTKRIGEDILMDTVKTGNLNAISLRYFNPVGAHHSGLIGEYPLGAPGNLMPVITQSAIGKRGSFKVFGTDYDTPDGTCIRDYIHVEDLALAHVLAINRLISHDNKSSFEVFNLGTGTGYSVVEIIKAFERVTGVKLTYELTDRRPGDVVKIFADNTYANQELGWKTKLGLDEMIDSAWKWEKNLAAREKISQS